MSKTSRILVSVEEEEIFGVFRSSRIFRWTKVLGIRLEWDLFCSMLARTYATKKKGIDPIVFFLLTRFALA